jgi:hypothetical protein
LRRVIAYHGRCFDGAFSAALMNELSERLDGAATDVVYRPLAHQKGGGIDPAWLDGDVNAVVDFRYTTSPALSWWFDHHKSAFVDEAHRAHFEQRAGERRVFEPSYSSCAKLISDVARDRFGQELGAFAEVLGWADMIDSARFESAAQAVELEHPALRLMTYIEGSSHEEVNALIPRFGRESLEQLVSAEPVRSRFAELLAQHRDMIELFRAQAELAGPVMFADLSRNPLDGFNKFIGFYLFPQVVYSVVVTDGPSRSKVSVGSNPWRTEERRHDIAALCEPHGGGGHAAVGAVTLPPGHPEEARRVAKQVVEQLSRPTA